MLLEILEPAVGLEPTTCWLRSDGRAKALDFCGPH